MATETEIKRWQNLVGTTPDGKPGPVTFEHTVAFLNERGWIVRDTPSVALVDQTRARVVEIALGELGPGGMPKEQDPQKYIREVAPIYVGLPPGAKAWCGIFALWCLTKAGLTSVKWADGRGFAMGYLPIVSIPEPGDVMYFGGKLSHYAIVRRVAGGRVYTVEGNTLPAPLEGVTAKDHPINVVSQAEPKGCYFSIKNLIPRSAP